MKKQKAGAIDSCGIKPTKIRKVDDTPISSQNRGLSQFQTNYQSTSQSINFTQTIDDSVTNNELDRLIGIWTHAEKDHLFSINDNQEQFRELQDHLAQDDLRIKKLQSNLRKVEEKNVTITELVESEVTMQNQNIKKQNVALCLMSVVQEHTDVITDTLRHYEESEKDLMELYNQTSSKQEEDIKKLIEQCNNQCLMEERELIEKLELKNSELISAQENCLQYKNKIAKMDQQILEVSIAAEECEKMINENRTKYEDEIKRISDGVENVEKNLTIVKQENSKLEAENDERSKQLEDLLLQQEVLQLTPAQFEKQMEYLQIELQELKEKEMNMVNKVAELNNEHLESVSNKNLELNDYRKQLEDLTLRQIKNKNKLSEWTSKNKELSQAIADRLENIEQLKKTLQNKNDETVGLNGKLTSALEKQQELYSTIKNIQEQLTLRENKIEQIKADSESCRTRSDKRAERICKMRTRLAAMQKILEDKCREEAQLLEKAENDEIEFAERVNHYEQEIVHKDRQINELVECEENLRKKMEREDYEHNKKLQEKTRSSKKCELAQHEKQIKEQNAEIDALTKEVAAENLKLEKRNLKKVEAEKRKTVETIEFKDMKVMFASLKERYSVIEQTNKKLNEEWREVQTLNKTENTRRLLFENSSPLLAKSYTRNRSISAASTPIQSTSKNQRSKYSSEPLSSDLSSINGLTPVEDRDCAFDMLLRSNKTDAAKLSEPDLKEKLLTSPILLNVTPRARDDKLVKQYRRIK